MRVKFEKGMTPEAIADVFVKFVQNNELVIGTVNMYIQTFDEEMKPEKHNRYEESLYVCEPSDATKRRYQEYVANARRARIKAV